jgi:hypothetical protein
MAPRIRYHDSLLCYVYIAAAVCWFPSTSHNDQLAPNLRSRWLLSVKSEQSFNVIRGVRAVASALHPYMV